MNRRDFAKSALISAGLGSVAVAEVERPSEGEVLLLSVPYGHCEAERTAGKIAVNICEKLHCDVIVIPDIMKLERISKADADRLIQHISENPEPESERLAYRKMLNQQGGWKFIDTEQLQSVVKQD